MAPSEEQHCLHPALQRIDQPGKKKILALDGGGIRGIISLEILGRLEADLRQACDQPDLLLGDFFDFICGTSTGAIIATSLSAGMSVQQVKDFYVQSGPAMFTHGGWYKALEGMYEAEPLREMLREVFNKQLNGSDYVYSKTDPAVLLGDPRLKGLLMVVLRNYSTDSPWPVSNNPRAHYNQLERDDCNLNLPLWQVVRASTAAPLFFPPEVVKLAAGTPREYEFVFVDGGITAYNNPAFLAFQMATASPYRINWSTGVDNLLIVSIGTGSAPQVSTAPAADELLVPRQLSTVPKALMNAASAGWDMVCRILGECRFGDEIDREFGSMVLPPEQAGPASNWTGLKQFAYVRYSPLMTRQGLDQLGLTDLDPAALQPMDHVASIKSLERLGQAYSQVHVRLEHLRGFI